MKSDGRSFDGEALQADICIVGGGPAGLTLAHALRDSGLDILLLESGDEGLDRGLQALNDGEADPQSRHAPPQMYRQRRLGGASAIWGGRCVPYDPIDFEPIAGLRAGWPIPYGEVAAYYSRAMAYLEAGAADFDAKTSLPGTSALIEGFADPVVRADTLERFSLPTHFGRRWSAEIVGSDKVRLMLATTVVRLRLSADLRTIEALDCAAGDRRFTVRARTVVLAAGGLETVRLLAVAGLEGPSPKLGRGYMCHIEGTLGRLELAPHSRAVHFGFERTLDGVYARRRLSIADAVKRERPLLNFIARLHHENVVDPGHRNGVLSAMYLAKSFIIPEYRRKLSMVEYAAAARMPTGARFWGAHVGNLVADSPRVSAFTVDWSLKRYAARRRIPYVALKSRRGVYPLDYNAEQIPSDDSRVRLSDAVDAHGVPKIRVEWRMAAVEAASAAASLRLVRDAVARADVGRFQFDDGALEDEIRANATPVGGHHIGAARMSAAASDGVVDPNLRLHAGPEVFVLGAAAFPTSSHANPTLTIVAMALRLADHLKAAGRST